jgi:hypothetical protein
MGSCCTKRDPGLNKDPSLGTVVDIESNYKLYLIEIERAKLLN